MRAAHVRELLGPQNNVRLFIFFARYGYQIIQQMHVPSKNNTKTS
jgi:hypothetical protein